MQVKKQHLELDMEQWTGSTYWERSMSRLYIVTLLIYLLCRVHHSKCLDEAQAGINIAGRNINNLRYADDTTLMAEREEELKSFLMRVKKLA